MARSAEALAGGCLAWDRSPLAGAAWWLAGECPRSVHSPLACNWLVAGECLSFVTLLPLACSAEALAGGCLVWDRSPLAGTAWWLAGERPWFERSPLACNRLVAGERLSFVTLLPLACSAEALAGG